MRQCLVCDKFETSDFIFPYREYCSRKCVEVDRQCIVCKKIKDTYVLYKKNFYCSNQCLNVNYPSIE